MKLHLGSAPAEYNRTDQNVMRRAIENVLLDGLDATASNIGDIVITDAEPGQILVYSSGQWINHTQVLNDISDVIVTGAVNEDFLMFDGDDWVDQHLHTDLVDVRATTLHHTLSQLHDEQLSSGWDGGGIITATGPLEVSIAAGSGYFADSDIVPNDLYYVEWPEITGVVISPSSVSWVGLEWSGGVVYPVVRTSNVWNYVTEWPLGNIVTNAGTIFGVSFNPFLIRQGVGTLAHRIIETGEFARAFDKGMIVGEYSAGPGLNRYLTMTAGDLWAGLDRVEAPAVNTYSDAEGKFFVHYVSGVGNVVETDQRVWATSDSFTAQPDHQLQWLWNDTTDPVDPLKQMTTNKWGIWWTIISSNGFPIFGFHDVQYNTEAQAEDALPPAHFDFAYPQLISKIVFQQGKDIAASIFSLWDIQGVAGAAVASHSQLTNLGSDDHSQYLHLSISRDVTAQHTFSVFGTGDWLAGEWDILIGDTVTNAGGAINVGGAALSMAGGMGPLGTPGITLDGAVTLSNRGPGPAGNVEFAFTDSTDAIRFALAISGAGFATYNPRSFIIAGPAVADDDIVTGAYWGFTHLPMDTGLHGADLGVQHDLQILSKLWVDNIGSSSAGTITFDEAITTQTIHITDVDNVELHLEATGVDSTAWMALENDAREYRLRITGANVFDIYDVTAASVRMSMGTAGDFDFQSGDIITLGQGFFSSIRCTTSVITPAVASLTDLTVEGGNVTVEATNGDLNLLASGDVIMGDVSMGALTATTGDFSGSITIDSASHAQLFLDRPNTSNVSRVNFYTAGVLDWYIDTSTGANADMTFYSNGVGTALTLDASNLATICGGALTATRITSTDKVLVDQGSGFVGELGHNAVTFTRAGTSYIDQTGVGGSLIVRTGAAYNTRMQITDTADISLVSARDVVVTGNLKLNRRGDYLWIEAGGGSGQAAVMGHTSTNSVSGSKYGAYFSYDSYWRDSVEMWEAVRPSLGRKWMIDMGYHINQFRVRYYDGTIVGGWADSAWSDLFWVDSGGNTTVTGQVIIKSSNTKIVSDTTSIYLHAAGNTYLNTASSAYVTNTGVYVGTQLILTDAGSCSVFIKSATDNAILYIDSGIDGGGEQSLVMFRGGASPTVYWQVGKDPSHGFYIYDNDAAKEVFKIVGSGDMTLSPDSGEVYVTGNLHVDDEFHFGNVTDAVQFHYVYGNPSGQSYLRYNDGATWGDMRIDHANQNVQFRVASSTVLAIWPGYIDLRQAVTIPIESQTAAGTLALRYSADNDTGLFKPGSNIFGIAAGGVEAVRFDNTTVAGNTRMLLYDVDNGYTGRVTVGAANSGGSGYKLLRIPN